MRWSGSGTSTAPSISSSPRKAAELGGEVERFAVFDDRSDMRRVAQHRNILTGISVEDDDIGDHPRLDRTELTLKPHRQRILTRLQRDGLQRRVAEMLDEKAAS